MNYEQILREFDKLHDGSFTEGGYRDEVGYNKLRLFFIQQLKQQDIKESVKPSYQTKTCIKCSKFVITERTDDPYICVECSEYFKITLNPKA